ncbi:MAG: reverse transcriptase family protein [Vampirovibrionales bacterium]
MSIFIPKLRKLIDFCHIYSVYFNPSDFHILKPNGAKRKITKFSHQAKYAQTLLNNILDKIESPSYRYCRKKQDGVGYDNIHNAKHHSKSRKAITLDLENFFPNTTKSEIIKFFQEFSIFRNTLSTEEIESIIRFTCCESGIGLAQGSRCSSNLAFWTNYKMFNGLYNLAQKNNLLFTVYVDDITFSGDEIPAKFIIEVKKSVRMYGHRIKDSKTHYSSRKKGINITGILVKKDKIQPNSKFFEKGKVKNPNVKPYLKRIYKILSQQLQNDSP